MIGGIFGKTVALILVVGLGVFTHAVFAMMPPLIVKIGTEAPLGDFGVTLQRVNLSGSVLAISYAVKNISPAPASLAGLPLLRLQNPAGGEAPAFEDNARDRTLAPGEKTLRQAKFRLPPGAADPMAWLLRIGGDAGPGITLR